MNSVNGDVFRREVESLHTAFMQWFSVDESVNLPNDFPSRWESVLAPTFTIRTPDGPILSRDEILKKIRDSPGTRAGLRIWIEDFRMGKDESDESTLTTSPGEPGDDFPAVTVRYRECQIEGGKRKDRESIAVMRQKDGLPNKVEWLSVHETWCEEEEVRSSQ